MRRIFTGTAVLIFCITLLGGCAAGDGTMPEYITEELCAERDGNRIYGVVYIPQNAGVEEIPDTYFSLWMTIGRVYAENLLDYDIYEAISGYEKDVLILHGDADEIVPLSYSEKALEIYSSAQMEVFPGAGHGFYGEDAQRAIHLILEYLESHRDK